jgi:hypothetical protein
MQSRPGVLASWVVGVSQTASLGCVVAERPVALPGGDHAAVGVMSASLGEFTKPFARHAWIAVRERGSHRWVRFENGRAGTAGEDPLRDPCECRGPSDLSQVRAHGLIEGREAERAIRCIDAETRHYRDEYRFWPGPNCNTYVERMLRVCGVELDLPATAVGRDYRGVLGASVTSGGTGVQVDSPLLGFKVGLKEGVEIHWMTLPIGVDLWPPALIVPLGPGRLGFDDR